MKELGPEGGPSKKNNNGGEQENEVVEKGNEKYKNAELAMLCTHSVSIFSCILKTLLACSPTLYQFVTRGRTTAR